MHLLPIYFDAACKKGPFFYHFPFALEPFDTEEESAVITKVMRCLIMCSWLVSQIKMMYVGGCFTTKKKCRIADD